MFFVFFFFLSYNKSVDGSDGKRIRLQRRRPGFNPWVWFDQKDPLEKGMATHSSIFAWEIPWTEELGRLYSKESQRVGQNTVINAFQDCWESLL